MMSGFAATTAVAANLFQEPMMQAFRVAATVGTNQEVHLAPVPFRPGSTVEVIVLEQAPVPLSTGRSSPGLQVGPARGDSDEHPAAEVGAQRRTGVNLAREQYRLARRYPAEYVVLVGERVVHHSSDRRSAFRAFDQALAESPGIYPVIVEPGDEPHEPPVFRGRSFRGGLAA